MDRSKLYINKSEDFTTLAVEGNVLPLKDCIEEYLSQGRYKKEVDFSPVVRGGSFDDDFMAANIYGKRFCTLTASQTRTSAVPNTSLVCSGNDSLPLGFLEDFVEVIKFEMYTPSKELITEAAASQMPIFMLYKRAANLKGKDFAAEFVSLTLKEQQKVYVRDSKIEIAHKN